jgi:hypothetical protein
LQAEFPGQTGSTAVLVAAPRLMRSVQIADNFSPACKIDQPPVAGTLAILMGFAARVVYLHSIRAVRAIAAQPVVQLVDKCLDLCLIGDPEVLKLPLAQEAVMQLQALLPLSRLIRLKLDRCVFDGDVDDPDRGGRGHALEVLYHH